MRKHLFLILIGSAMLGGCGGRMSDEQRSFESLLFDIKFIYENENQANARRMYDTYNAGIGDSGIQVVDSICRIEHIGETTVQCRALQKNITIRYYLRDYRAFDKYKLKLGDRILFCGLLTKESSLTTWGGILLPEFRIRNAFIYNDLGDCQR